MAAICLVAFYLSASLCAFAALLLGLLALSAYPNPRVLVTISGMALLLHAASGLGRMQEFRVLISRTEK